MAYEAFERTVTRPGSPMLSVLPDGRITFNAAASRLFQAEGVEAVRILWDREKCGVALKASGKSDRNAYSIYFSRGRSAAISPKAFLAYIGWSARKRYTVPAKWNQRQKMIEAELPRKFIASYGRGAIDQETDTRM